LRGPSGERNQIQFDGTVEKVSLFHGRADEELDWHVYLRLFPSVARRLAQFLREHNVALTDQEVDRPYCELMLIDDWHRRSITWPPQQASFQRKYDSADLSRVLRLSKPGSDHPAYDLGRDVADEPGENKDLSASSRLCRDRGRVYMQGLLVLDVAHSPATLEVHPPDSIAFAIGDTDRTVSAVPGEEGWPDRTIRWRVAWFANSNYHRICDEEPLKQRRTTTWYLPLPGPPAIVAVPATHALDQVEVTTTAVRLWDSKDERWYDSRGVADIDDARFEADPRDNTRRLRVGATMQVSDSRGGLVVRDYLVRRRPPVIAPG
jgi:hypothetical protein